MGSIGFQFVSNEISIVIRFVCRPQVHEFDTRTGNYTGVVFGSKGTYEHGMWQWLCMWLAHTTSLAPDLHVCLARGTVLSVASTIYFVTCLCWRHGWRALLKEAVCCWCSLHAVPFCIVHLPHELRACARGRHGGRTHPVQLRPRDKLRRPHRQDRGEQDIGIVFEWQQFKIRPYWFNQFRS